jgi:hypothetical protein
MTVDVSALTQSVRDHGRDVAKRLAASFVETAQGFAPRQSGAGADSIEAQEVEEGGSGYTVSVTVGEEYMRYQNEGTGIYGPLGTPIVPTHGRFLRFDSKVGGGIVFARSVRGTEPTHWWERTMMAWPSIVRDAAG